MKFRAQRPFQSRAVIGALVCLLVAACGQKGALYIPEPDQPPAVSPQTLPEPGAADPLSFPEQQALPAEDEDGIPEAAGSDETSEAAPE